MFKGAISFIYMENCGKTLRVRKNVKHRTLFMDDLFEKALVNVVFEITHDTNLEDNKPSSNIIVAHSPFNKPDNMQ